jgi:protein TonB
MKTTIAIFLAASVLAGCGTTSPANSVTGAGAIDKVETTRDGTSTAGTLNDYKQDIAQRISQVNSTKVFVGRPQALLRSVIVVKYWVDGSGNLLRSDILRSNHDRANEATALATLRNTAPFPKPAPHLLRRGRVEILESWLFNNDGRFQLRTIAEPQASE